MLKNKNWGEGMFGQVAIAWRLVEHQSACGRWQVIAFASPEDLAFYFFPSLKLSLSQHMSSLAFAFPILSPVLTMEAGGSEGAAVWGLPVGHSQPTTAVQARSSWRIYAVTLCNCTYSELCISTSNPQNNSELFQSKKSTSVLI